MEGRRLGCDRVELGDVRRRRRARDRGADDGGQALGRAGAGAAGGVDAGVQGGHAAVVFERFPRYGVGWDTRKILHQKLRSHFHARLLGPGLECLAPGGRGRQVRSEAGRGGPGLDRRPGVREVGQERWKVGGDVIVAVAKVLVAELVGEPAG